jgi:hypothetical protein
VFAQGGPSYPRAQASFVIAMIIPITTNTTIATCVQIQNGDIAETAYFDRRDSLLRRLKELSPAGPEKFAPAFAKLCGYSFSPPMGQTSPTVVTGAARKG